MLYSNRTSQSDSRYRGFGSAEILAQAEELVRDGGWKAAGQPRRCPEDARQPRGIHRDPFALQDPRGPADTDRAEDWHIVPTRKATFGAENCDEVYVP